MKFWQELFIVFYGLLGLIISIKGFIECYKKDNVHHETIYLFWLGIFVWGDAVVFGLFWFLISMLSVILKDWVLFLLFISVFWLVRSLGETFYWFNQQFSPLARWPKKRFDIIDFLSKYFKDGSIWFIYQISWQCVTVISLITTIYLTTWWLHNKF